MLIGMSTAQAAGGRIVFSGAVVESTCATEGAPINSGSRGGDASLQRRMSCGRTATDPGRSYSRMVISLAEADLAHDRLLGYFASYAPVADDGKVAAKVVVHTYD
ncbi:MAG TPA: hypothetical protein VFN09_11990 [Rhodanobacteraceae bacterium]|nr:hypothetical protein [Rhodanobacteraceae bacterium]